MTCINQFCVFVQDRDGEWVVKCAPNSCQEQLYLGTIDPHTANLSWALLGTTGQLQAGIQRLIGQPSVGYCLIHCGTDPVMDLAENIDDYYNIHDIRTESQAQILNLPPVLKPQGKRKLSKSYVNYNFLFIDSVSRHHFFRTLPKTVQVLDSINHLSGSMVLDFELIQGVRSRTFESLQALFSGSIDPYSKPFGTQAMPKTKLNVGEMLNPLKKLGYGTLWQEDLCPFWEWGISKDLLVYNKSLNSEDLWKKLSKELSNSYIDSLGNTHASCRILHSNGVADPFHGPESLCYNGKHQHQYHLDYLTMYQKTFQKHSQHFFTFLETNIGHEDTGQRVKYFDTHLTQYLNFAIKNLKSTLTVIFSDHGNAYGQYVKDTPEGRLETYQPFMFLIVPEDLQSLLTKSQLDALTINQKRLVSMLDFHYTFTHLIHLMSQKPVSVQVSEFNKQFNVTQSGLLDQVSAHRTCSLIPRIMPNLCICSGYDVPSTHYAFHYILAQIFVGILNNEILAQKAKGINSSGHVAIGDFGSCHRLKVSTVKNVQVSKINVSNIDVLNKMYFNKKREI